MDPQLLERQRKLGDFNSWLIQLPGVYDAGFVEGVNDAETMSVTHLWAGSSPLQATVRQEALNRGINLTIQPVKYTMRQLEEGKEKLFKSVGRSSWNGFVITMIKGTDLDHDGLTVVGHYPGSASTTAAQQQSALTFAKSISDVVIGIEVAPPAVPLTTRSTDTDPFYAGGMMRAVGSYQHCSSGFGVKVPWATNGIAKITIARHCDASQYVAWDNPSGPYSNYGINVTTTSSGGRVLSSHGSFWMFDGAWNNPDGYIKSTVGYFDVRVGDYVCTSGAMSGVHCGLRVTSTTASWNDGFGVIPIILASATSAPYYAGAPGDSGGPVLVPYPDNNWSSVGAAGMIQLGTDLRLQPCGNGTRDPNQGCYSTVGFTSMRRIVNDIGGGATLYSINS